LDLNGKKIVIMICIGIGLTPNALSPYINIFCWVIAVLLSKKEDIGSYGFFKRRKRGKINF